MKSQKIPSYLFDPPITKSPNSGVFWQKERIRIRAGRRKSRISSHFFCDPGLSGFSSENGLITSLKNVPDRPFWLVDRLSARPVDRECEEIPVLMMLIFRIRPVKMGGV